MDGKILIVDDEKEIADLIEVCLQNDGYTVWKCYNGIEALKYVETVPFDLAILDVMLPDIDGFRICQKIRVQRIRAAGAGGNRRDSGGHL